MQRKMIHRIGFGIPQIKVCNQLQSLDTRILRTEEVVERGDFSRRGCGFFANKQGSDAGNAANYLPIFQSEKHEPDQQGYRTT